MGSFSHLLKRGTRSMLGAAMVHTGIWKIIQGAASSGAGRIIVLGYHRVVPDPDLEGERSLRPLITSTDIFKKHMEVIAETSRVVSMDEVAAMLNGRKPCKGTNVAITFDDGYRDVYENAFPILRDMGFQAAVYVPTGHIGSERPLSHDKLFMLLKWLERMRGMRSGLALQETMELFLEGMSYDGIQMVIEALERELPQGSPLGLAAPTMDWDQLREMVGNGISVGVHTVNHSVLTHLEPEQVRREVADARDDIEGRLGGRAVHFSFPNGRYSEKLAGVLSDLRFQTAVTTEDRTNMVGDDPMAIGRTCVWDGTTRGLFSESPRALIVCQLLGIFRHMGLARDPVPGVDLGNLGSESEMVYQLRQRPQVVVEQDRGVDLNKSTLELRE